MAHSEKGYTYAQNAAPQFVIENVALPKSLILLKFLAQIFCFTINIQLTPNYGMLFSRTSIV